MYSRSSSSLSNVVKGERKRKATEQMNKGLKKKKKRCYSLVSASLTTTPDCEREGNEAAAGAVNDSAKVATFCSAVKSDGSKVKRKRLTLT